MRGCRIQSPHSTVGNELPEILGSKTRTREGGQEGRIRDVDINANVRLVSAKRLNKRQKPAVLLKGVGGSNGMDGTYVGSPGNGVKGGKCSHAVAKCLFR